MTIEELSFDTLDVLLPMVLALWPECNDEEERAHYKGLISTSNSIVFLAKAANEYIGFIHLALRFEFVEGTDSSPVAYVEGIYVAPAFRQKGVGKLLVERGKKWGLQHNCSEMASDAELHNENSIDFHKHIGFEEVNRIVCFRKDL